MWTFSQLVPTKVHYMKKILDVFLKNISFFSTEERKNMNILDDIGVSKLSRILILEWTNSLKTIY